MAKFTYEVDIPGYGTQVVESDTKLTDLQAYEYAKSAAQPRSMGEEFTRGAGLAARGAAPVAAGAGLGFMVGGPVGAGVGTLALPLAEVGTQAINLALPKEYQIPSPYGAVENLLTQLGLPVPETTGERIIQAAGGVLPSTAAQTTAAQTLSQTAQSQLGRNIAGQMAAQPGRQLAASVPATAAAQYVGEATGRPELGMLAGMATSAPFAAGTRPSGPSRQVLEAQSTAAFEAAKQSGIALNPTIFSDEMGKIAVNLRREGYTPTGYPKIEAAFREMMDTSMPKDFTELQALRKIIQGAQSSIDKEERRLASILKDKFDEYILNADKTQIVGAGTKEGVNAWNQARNTYSRMMKAEVFEDMLANAEIEKGKTSLDTYLSNQIKSLAKNEKKMRLFTANEQAEIREAAKSSNMQRILSLIGRISPSANALMGGGNLVFSVSNPQVGIPLAVTAGSARFASNKMRERSIQNLADIMRTGGLQPRQDSAARALATRGLISPQQPVTEEEINLLMGR